MTHALAVSLGPDVLVNCIAPGWINVTDQQDFITGETITVDGGMNKRMIYHGDWNWHYHVD